MVSQKAGFSPDGGLKADLRVTCVMSKMPRATRISHLTLIAIFFLIHDSHPRPHRAYFAAAFDPPFRADSYIARAHVAALHITKRMGDSDARRQNPGGPSRILRSVLFCTDLSSPNYQRGYRRWLRRQMDCAQHPGPCVAVASHWPAGGFVQCRFAPLPALALFENPKVSLGWKRLEYEY